MLILGKGWTSSKLNNLSPEDKKKPPLYTFIHWLGFVLPKGRDTHSDFNLAIGD